MAAKLGFEAIKYVLKKVLTKKGVKGIATIPGKSYDMRMKQLVDEMANKMRTLGYDINKVTEKNVQGLLDSAEALAKQRRYLGEQNSAATAHRSSNDTNNSINTQS